MAFEPFHVEIPRLSFNGIEFGEGSFSYTYRLQSSDSSSFDFTTLSIFICSKSPYCPTDMSLLLSPTATEWEIGRGLLNREGCSQVCLYNHTHCRRVVIGKGCFTFARTFRIDQWSQLESIVIRRKSFTIYQNTPQNSRRRDGTFQITSCPKLEFIQIGDCSFSDYHFFTLCNLPSLLSIRMGDYCFYPSTVLSLKSLPD